MNQSSSITWIGALVTLLFFIGCDSGANWRGNLLSAPMIQGVQNVAQINESIAKLPALESLRGSAKCDVTVMQIEYETPGVKGDERSNASAALLLPSGVHCPSNPYPLIAYARGTAIEKAHTNATMRLPDIQVLMAVFASQGYVVVATDYLGYARSNYPYHPFMHADTTANTVMDSLRAARNTAHLRGITLSDKVMLTGFSQGGHASLATQRRIEADHTGEFNVVATAHLVGPYEVSKALINGVSQPIGGVQALVPFQIVSWQKIYGDVYAQASDVFNAPYDSSIETLMPIVNYPLDLGKLPRGTPEEAKNAMFKPAYLRDLVENPANGTIVAAKKQDVLGWDPKAPMMLCSGKNDPVVKFFHAQDAFDDFRSRGMKNIALVDVDKNIAQTFGHVRDTDMSTYLREYHGTYDFQFCTQVAKHFFDAYQ